MKILLWRILAIGIVLELLYGVFVFGVLGSNAAAYELPGLLGVFVFMMVGGVLIGWKADWQPAVQGALVGVTAVAFYLLLFGTFTFFGVETGEADTAEPVPWSLWWLNHGLKLVGGVVGGFIGGTWLKRSNEEMD